MAERAGMEAQRVRPVVHYLLLIPLKFLQVAQQLEAIEDQLNKEIYLDPEDNPLKLLRRLRILCERIPVVQKEFDQVCHQEQEIAEKLSDAIHHNSTQLKALEQRVDLNGSESNARYLFIKQRNLRLPFSRIHHNSTKPFGGGKRIKEKALKIVCPSLLE